MLYKALSSQKKAGIKKGHLLEKVGGLGAKIRVRNLTNRQTALVDPADILEINVKPIGV
jgi:hypothetical protein